ncbi:M50 family metallopeptidase [Armatimonas rosea]|uniref:M50 family peptidase n=1 Tax=Armatimonas rosea TaxID=685828 RepID=A0A7W9W809_ARMRO|nr:M50 family metallopeptidase [Armatimonas rosea]MBB6052248.1 hypothetical protein [Armatimonas rosea]
MKANTTRSILLGAVLTIALSFVPYAGFLTYPARLFVTFIHEGGHALAALLTGGLPTALGVSPDGSGVTLTRGGVGAVINAAGYLGATLFGALILAGLRRGIAPKRLLTVMGACVALTLPLAVFGLASAPGAWFALVTGVPIAGALLLAAKKLARPNQELLVGFLGVQCVLNAFYDLKTLFLLSAQTNVHTDAMNMQQATWIPAIVWASLWMVSAVVILIGLVIRPMLRDLKTV